MSDTLKIRTARQEDDSIIGEILVRAFVEGYSRKMPEVVVTDERKADLRNVAEKRAIATVLVAEREGRVVGSVTLFPPGAPRSEAWLPKSADLRTLGILPEEKGRGVADRLVGAAEDLARSWNCDSVCLHVRRGAHGVARFYESRGYLRDSAGDLEYPTVSLVAYRLALF